MVKKSARRKVTQIKPMGASVSSKGYEESITDLSTAINSLTDGMTSSDRCRRLVMAQESKDTKWHICGEKIIFCMPAQIQVKNRGIYVHDAGHDEDDEDGTL